MRNSVARPRKEEKPTTSVTAINTILPASAGSMPEISRRVSALVGTVTATTSPPDAMRPGPAWWTVRLGQSRSLET